LYEIDTLDYFGVEVNNKIVKAYRCTQEIWGKKRVCILTFSRDLYAGQIKELNENILKTKNELDELNIKLNNEKSRISKKEENIRNKIKQILNRKHMDEIFEVVPTIVEGNAKNIKYMTSVDKKNNIVHKYYEKKLIITDRDDWSTEELITTYREQDCIEKIFKSTKDSDHFSIRPQYHYTDQKIRVHYEEFKKYSSNQLVFRCGRTGHS
jgi:transposase